MIPGTTVDIYGRTLNFGTPNNKKPTGGHCCRCFTLGWTFLELDAAYKAAAAGEATFASPTTHKTHAVIRDILTLGPMLRLVGVCKENPLTGDKFPEPRKVWRCIHNKDDFTCAIYDRRPDMCKRYPKNLTLASQTCQYTHCESASCPEHPRKEKT